VTPIVPPDDAALAAFWDRCVGAGGFAADTPRPAEVLAFGDHAQMADELADLVVAGTKRATAGAAVHHGVDEPPPKPRDLAIVVDGQGRPRAVIRTTEVRIGPLSSVDDAFAWDEGEGDRTRATWLSDHEAFFRRTLPADAFHDDTATVFERFEVLCSE
jgi:uncharacterized protein YhfF